MRRRRLIALAAAAVLLSLAAAPFIVRRSARYYTDGAGFRSDARAARPFLRDVLWEPAAPVQGGINFPEADEYEPRVSPDGMHLVFTRGRPGLPPPRPGFPPSSPGGADLWIAGRDGGRWTEPRPLEEVNSPADEMGAAFGPARPGSPGGAGEGLALFFSSDRPGGEGGYDIWVSVREEGGGWSAPVNLGPPVNTPRNEISPLPGPGGRTLYFAADRGGGQAALSPRWRATLREAIEPPDYDIHRAARAPGDGTAFGPAERIDALNTPGTSEGSLALSPRGEILYFASNRPGGRGGFDIYRARLPGGAIGLPENLGPGINTAADELDPALVSGGFELYFARGGAGLGSDDILVSTSREVFLRREPGEPYWSLAALRAALFSLLRRIDPAILALILSVLAAIIFAVLFGKRMTRLGLLARCIVLALFVHLLLALWMGSTKVHRILIANLPVDGEGVAFEVTLGGEAEEEVSFAIRTEIAETGSDAPPGLEMARIEGRPAAEDEPSPLPAIEIAAPAAPGPLVPAVPPVSPPVDPALRDLARGSESFVDATLAGEQPGIAEFAPDPREPGREATPRPAEPQIDLAALRPRIPADPARISPDPAPGLPEADVRATALEAPGERSESSFRDRLALVPPPDPGTSRLADPTPDADPGVLENAPEDSRAAESLAAARDAGPPPALPAVPSPAILRDMVFPTTPTILPRARREEGAVRLEPAEAAAARTAGVIADAPPPAIEREPAAAGPEAASGPLPESVPEVAASGPRARPTEPEIEPRAHGAIDVVSRAAGAAPALAEEEAPPPALLLAAPREAADPAAIPAGPARIPPDPALAATREPAAPAPVEALLRGAAEPVDVAPGIAGARPAGRGEAGPALASDAAPGVVVTLREPPVPAASAASASAAALEIVAATSLPRARIPDAAAPAPDGIRAAVIEAAPALASEAAALVVHDPAPDLAPGEPAARATEPELDHAVERALEVASRAGSPEPGPPRSDPAPALGLASPGEADRRDGPLVPSAPGPAPPDPAPVATRETALSAPGEPILRGAAAAPEPDPGVVAEARPAGLGEAGPSLAPDAAPGAAVARRDAPAPVVPVHPASVAALEAAAARSLPRGRIPDAAAPAPGGPGAAAIETAARPEAPLPAPAASLEAPRVGDVAAERMAPGPAAPGAAGLASLAIDVARRDARRVAPSPAGEEPPPPVASLASADGRAAAVPAPAFTAANPASSIPSRDAPAAAAESLPTLPAARPAVEADPPGIVGRPGTLAGEVPPPGALPVSPPTIARERMEGPLPRADAPARPVATLAVQRLVRSAPMRGAARPADFTAAPASFSVRGEPLRPRGPPPADVPAAPSAPRSRVAIPAQVAPADPARGPTDPARAPLAVTRAAPGNAADAGTTPSSAGLGLLGPVIPADPAPAPVDPAPAAPGALPAAGASLASAPVAPPGAADLPPPAAPPEPASMPPTRPATRSPPPPIVEEAAEMLVALRADPAAPPAPLLEPSSALGTASPGLPLAPDSATRREPLPAPSRGGSLAVIAAAPDRGAGAEARSRPPEASSFVPRVYQLREKGRREEAVKRGGGSPETERAVERGLLWLALHQSPDGRWSLFDYARHLPRVSERDLWCPDWDGRGRHDARGGSGRAEDGDTAATGLAVLAFLGHGDTHAADGPFRENVKRGLDFLVRSQRRDGDLRGGGNLYMHAIAAFAICEAYALTRDPKLEEPSRRAVGYTLRTQNPDLGGWRYDPYPEGRDVDTSVFGWMLMALKSARVAGIEIEERPVSRMVRYLESARMTEAGGRYAYQPGLPRTSLAMTAQGLFCQQVLSEFRPPRGEEDARRLRRAAAESASHLLKNRPVARDQDGANFYYWYYASLALFQEGGEAWTAWNERLKDVLLKLQLGDDAGTAAGSWDPLSRRARSGGRVYSTAMSILCLEVYYRYAKKEGGR